MASLTFEGEYREPRSGESALDTLLRAGHAMPHSCGAGASLGDIHTDPFVAAA